jgi:small subunit ribosomal protein S20
MPNTKSAIKRVRNTERKTLRNQHTKSRVKTLERSFRVLVGENKKDEATKALDLAISTLDKAAKKGAISKPTANRKKSRLANVLNKMA